MFLSGKCGHTYLKNLFITSPWMPCPVLSPFYPAALHKGAGRGQEKAILFQTRV